MRPAILLAVFLAAGPVFTVQDRAGLGAYLAFEIVASSTPAPAPSPSPTPASDVCDSCDGKGQVGDGTVMLTCGACGGTGKKSSSSMPVVEPPKASMPVMKSAPVVRSGPHWNVEGKWNYTTLELADHLRRSHGVNINGKTREQLEAIHDAIHNGQPIPSFGSAPRSTRSCPNGQCPTR